MHDLLKVWWQLNERTSNICLVGVDFKRHVACRRRILVGLSELASVCFPWIYRIDYAFLTNLTIIVGRNSLLYYLLALGDFLVQVCLRSVGCLGAWLVSMVVLLFAVLVGGNFI